MILHKMKLFYSIGCLLRKGIHVWNFTWRFFLQVIIRFFRGRFGRHRMTYARIIPIMISLHIFLPKNKARIVNHLSRNSNYKTRIMTSSELKSSTFKLFSQFLFIYHVLINHNLAIIILWRSHRDLVKGAVCVKTLYIVLLGLDVRCHWRDWSSTIFHLNLSFNSKNCRCLVLRWKVCSSSPCRRTFYRLSTWIY